jgi:addiction module RelB/DinJ family antitoxin
MTRSTMLHVRVDEEIKAQASEALASMGLSVSDAMRILLKRVVNDQAFPLELKVPKACDYTKIFFKDWKRLSHSGRYDLKRLKEAMLAE